MVVPHYIRAARPADAPSLAKIDACAEINPWSEVQFVEACSGTGTGTDTGNHRETALVSDENGRVDGYVVFSQVLDEASVHRIAVHPEHRGRGLGQSLLQAALAQMRRDGANRCLLEVRQSNAAAQRLYEGNGFRLDGVRKMYYPAQGGREDALLMSRTL